MLVILVSLWLNLFFFSFQILTPADFEKMKRLRQQADLAKIALTKGQKRKLESAADEIQGEAMAESLLSTFNFARNPDEIIDPELLLRNTKKRKQTYEERLASIEAGREGREKFGSNQGQKDHGFTNKEKAKKKNFGMIRYKKEVRAKQFRSMREKQVAHYKAVEKEKKKIH